MAAPVMNVPTPPGVPPAPRIMRAPGSVIGSGNGASVAATPQGGEYFCDGDYAAFLPAIPEQPGRQTADLEPAARRAAPRAAALAARVPDTPRLHRWDSRIAPGPVVHPRRRAVDRQAHH